MVATTRRRRATADRIVPGEPIQWHLNTSARDVCPRCRGPVWFLGRRRRLCGRPGCGVQMTLTIPTTSWERLARL